METQTSFIGGLTQRVDLSWKGVKSPGSFFFFFLSLREVNSFIYKEITSKDRKDEE